VARGWESKSIEDQINEREAQSVASKKTRPSQGEMERRAKRDALLLVRSRTATALETARDERYIALLRRTLEHLDSELSKLG
jgi:hypothetical protein